jgi:hypothetical protein
MLFCGSDPNGFVSEAQMKHHLKKSGGWKERTILRFTLPLAIAIFLSILYNLLPETGRLWFDWFIGENEWFPPNFIVRLGAIFLFLALCWLLEYFGRKGGAGAWKIRPAAQIPRKEVESEKRISREDER